MKYNSNKCRTATLAVRTAILPVLTAGPGTSCLDAMRLLFKAPVGEFMYRSSSAGLPFIKRLIN